MQLLHAKLKNTTLAQIQEIVRMDEKQRYKLQCEEGEWWIRANQGHSMKEVSHFYN
jgi:2'-phosphotransferase